MILNLKLCNYTLVKLWIQQLSLSADLPNNILRFEDTQEGAEFFALRKPGNIYTRITILQQLLLKKELLPLKVVLELFNSFRDGCSDLYDFGACPCRWPCSSSINYLRVELLISWKKPFLVMGLQQPLWTWIIWKKWKRLSMTIPSLSWVETLGNPWLIFLTWKNWLRLLICTRFPLVSDNTFATPYLINVFSHGVGIAIHSATKFIGGHGTTIGGVIVDSGRFDWAASGKFPQFVEDQATTIWAILVMWVQQPLLSLVRVQLLRDTSAALSPFNAFLLLQGLETLSPRVERHVQMRRKLLISL